MSRPVPPPRAADAWPSALDVIGNTALVALDRLHPGPGKLLAKLEMQNPGGSVKDRAARQIVLSARERGVLAPGQAVVEMTSGNMGAGLAVVCAVMGHPLVTVMSAGNSRARVRMLEALGARVVLVPQVDGVPGEVTGSDVRAAARRARAVADEAGGYYVDQFFNPAGVAAHEETTGPEVWAQTAGRLTTFVAAVGSGGTFVGTSRYLLRQNPKIQCFAVEPASAAVLAGQRVREPRHLLQGTGYGVVPPHWQPELASGTIAVSDDEAIEYRRRLAVEEGLYVGYSAAANVAAALRLLGQGDRGEDAMVVTVLCDTGLKY